MSPPRLGGPYRYTRAGQGVFHFPLARPWTWALTHQDLRCLFVEDAARALRKETASFERHPPQSLLGCWLAVYATPEYDAEAAGWMRRALGLVPPKPEALEANAYVAVGRLGEVSTTGNDSRCLTDAWWWGASPCRGVVAWWLEEVEVFEPLAVPAGRFLSLLEADVLVDMRERVRLARDGVWRPPRFTPPPPSLPRPAVVDDRPIPPMLETPEQFGLFGPST